MNERLPDDAPDSVLDALDHLEVVTRDEYLSDMNQKADDIEWQLETHCRPPSSVQLLLYRQQLEAEWRHMYRDVKVAGRLLVPDNTKGDTVAYVPKMIQDDETLVSTGFTFVALQGKLGVEDSVVYKVAYSFMRGTDSCAMLRDDFVGTFPGTSYEMAEKRLFYHHRDEVSRINERLARTDSPSIMEFRDYKLDVYLYARYNEGYIPDIEAYLYEVLHFDREVPYYVVYGNEQEKMAVTARPERVVILPLTDDDSESPRRHRPYIQLNVYGETSSDSGIRVNVPLDNLYQFESLRRPPRRLTTD